MTCEAFSFRAGLVKKLELRDFPIEENSTKLLRFIDRRLLFQQLR